MASAIAATATATSLIWWETRRAPSLAALEADYAEINDLGTGLHAAYTYDLYGQRTAETLVKNGELVHEQSYAYTNRGWLTDVLGHDHHSDETQTVRTTYQYDAAGNRARDVLPFRGNVRGSEGMFRPRASVFQRRMRAITSFARRRPPRCRPV